MSNVIMTKMLCDEMECCRVMCAMTVFMAAFAIRCSGVRSAVRLRDGHLRVPMPTLKPNKHCCIYDVHRI
ncbi:hypothetical protein DPX16_0964 [Anabarilius grahami]|uniref:Uncharacterized protein n=1 Tax=Anabarilius grahami TaxID=495550 RepID=A0A3N0YGD6_ANAGA|nr:hypothetical protein DPX16_0964 [Anabarilius grahami]